MKKTKKCSGLKAKLIFFFLCIQYQITICAVFSSSPEFSSVFFVLLHTCCKMLFKTEKKITRTLIQVEDWREQKNYNKIKISVCWSSFTRRRRRRRDNYNTHCFCLSCLFQAKECLDLISVPLVFVLNACNACEDERYFSFICNFLLFTSFVNIFFFTRLLFKFLFRFDYKAPKHHISSFHWF